MRREFDCCDGDGCMNRTILNQFADKCELFEQDVRSHPDLQIVQDGLVKCRGRVVAGQEPGDPLPEPRCLADDPELPTINLVQTVHSGGMTLSMTSRAEITDWPVVDLVGKKDFRHGGYIISTMPSELPEANTSS
jgi:hypothetical protein